MYRACFVLILFSLFGSIAGRVPCAQPIWAIDLDKTYHFQVFGVKKRENSWVSLTNQQGVEFISPEVLAVYQVSEVDEPQALRQKDPSGGSGRYLLHVSILDVTQKTELKSFQFVTSGWLPSRVFPTHDGRFLIRTGEIIRSFSANFDQVAIAHFPHKKTADLEWYEVSVSFSGKRLYIHYTASDSSRLVGGTAVLDADSLHPVEGLPQGDIPSGKVAAGFNDAAKDHSCPSGLARITPDLSVGYGCKELKLFSYDGGLLWDIPMNEQVASVRGAGALLAASIQHPHLNSLDPDIGPEPLQIALYDLATKSEKCSITTKIKSVPRIWSTIFYAVSSGEVAVIQGNILGVYRP